MHHHLDVQKFKHSDVLFPEFYLFLLPEDLRDFFFFVFDLEEPNPFETFFVWRLEENNEACFCFWEN